MLYCSAILLVLALICAALGVKVLSFVFGAAFIITLFLGVFRSAN